jgi:hypothetical protein
MSKELEFCLWLNPVFWFVLVAKMKGDEPSDFVAAGVVAAIVSGVAFCLINAIEVSLT